MRTTSEEKPDSLTSPRTRMAAEARRELVLAAATRAFARTGFAGTSTDAIAHEAQVSQPYVIRIFGTKQELFLATYDRASATIYDSFAEVVGDPAFDGCLLYTSDAADE